MSSKIKDNKDQIILFIVFALICILAFVYSIIRSNNEMKRLSKEYPKLRIEDSLNNTIRGIYRVDTRMLRESSSEAYRILDNGRNIYIGASFHVETRLGINEVLQISDRIRKDAGSDTIYIYKHNSKIKIDTCDYLFIIDTVY